MKKQLQNLTKLLSILLLISSFNVGCVSYKIRGGHTTNKQPQQPETNVSIIRKYQFASFTVGHANAPTENQVLRELTNINPVRFGPADTATPLKVAIIFDESSIIKKPHLFGLRLLPYWLSLGILPGGIDTAIEPIVNIMIIDNGQVFDLNGKIRLYSDQYLSCWTPLGLIYWGDAKAYQGDASEKGRSTILSSAKSLKQKTRQVEAQAIAYEINAIINNYENQLNN